MGLVHFVVLPRVLANSFGVPLASGQGTHSSTSFHSHLSRSPGSLGSPFLSRSGRNTMSIAPDISRARALFESAEREVNPDLKARALEEAIALLSSCDPDEMSDAERKLVTNLRLAHTRRLLVQLVTLTSVSMDAWLDYVHLLLGELSAEVEHLIEGDPELKENYARFLKLWGSQLAEILRRP